MDYQEQLKHPYWKIRRDEIVKRDKYRCKKCKCENHLEVHHKQYYAGFLAWEYADKFLVTLCRGCHEKEHIGKTPNDFIVSGKFPPKYISPDILKLIKAARKKDREEKKKQKLLSTKDGKLQYMKDGIASLIEERIIFYKDMTCSQSDFDENINKIDDLIKDYNYLKHHC